MTQAADERGGERAQRRAALAARLAWLAALPLFALAATRGLWAPDEPRRAEVAKELWEAGDFIVLRLCGELYPDKPPLLYWLAGALGALSGWSELAMRLAPLAATGLTAWLVARFARRAFGALEAAFAPALFLTTAMLFDQGHQLQIDPLLMACSTAALYLLDGSADRDRARRSRAVLAAGACTGLAALAKGPVAFVDVGLPLAAWTAWERWTRKGPAASASRASAGSIALALVLATGPVLAWALAAAAREPELARELFWSQHAGRVASGADHPGPFWKSAARLPLLLLPWTALVASGLLQAWRARRSSDPEARALVRAALWLAVLLVFFSAIPTKRDLYLLPAYPAAALLAARALGRAAGLRRVPRAWSLCAAALLALVVAAGLAAGPLGARFAEDLGGIEPASLAWRGALCALPAAAALVSLRRALRVGDVACWARAQVLGWAGAVLLGALLLVPLADPLKSSRELALWLADRPEDPGRIPCVGVKPEGYRFYGGVPTVAAAAGDLGAHLDREKSEFLALIQHRHWEELVEAERARMRILRDAEVGGRAFYVVGSAGIPPPGSESP